MNSKLFYLLIVIFLIISVSVLGETTGNRIIDKKEIEASGITQLSEIFTLIPEWPASSIDGVTWRVSPNGLEPFHHQRWKIILHSLNPYFFAIDTTIEDLNWHHVAVTRRDSIAKLYIDGLRVGNEISVSDSALAADPNGFIIGQDQDFVGGGFQAIQSWAGEIDNLRIYNRALTEQEILSLYNGSGIQ